MGRAKRITDDGVRLQAARGVLALTTAALAPHGLFDQTPTVLAMRIVHADPELECDVVVDQLTETTNRSVCSSPTTAFRPPGRVSRPRAVAGHTAPHSPHRPSPNERSGGSLPSRTGPPPAREKKPSALCAPRSGASPTRTSAAFPAASPSPRTRWASSPARSRFRYHGLADGRVWRSVAVTCSLAAPWPRGSRASVTPAPPAERGDAHRAAAAAARPAARPEKRQPPRKVPSSARYPCTPPPPKPLTSPAA